MNVFSLRKNDALSAKVTIERKLEMEMDGFEAGRREKIGVRFATEMSSNFDRFLIKNDLFVTRDGEEFFAKKWEEEVERNGV